MPGKEAIFPVNKLNLSAEKSILLPENTILLPDKLILLAANSCYWPTQTQFVGRQTHIVARQTQFVGRKIGFVGRIGNVFGGKKGKTGGLPKSYLPGNPWPGYLATSRQVLSKHSSRGSGRGLPV
jgi:hypothetical protein